MLIELPALPPQSPLFSLTKRERQKDILHLRSEGSIQNCNDRKRTQLEISTPYACRTCTPAHLHKTHMRKTPEHPQKQLNPKQLAHPNNRQKKAKSAHKNSKSSPSHPEGSGLRNCPFALNVLAGIELGSFTSVPEMRGYIRYIVVEVGFGFGGC